MKTKHIERLSAKQYYKNCAIGQVVLVNGHIVFHGSGVEAKKFEARIKSS
jgi:hypothetical protein